MVGRRMTAGGSTYMPLRVNMAGVIPVIFAAAIMAFPPTIAQYFPADAGLRQQVLPAGRLALPDDRGLPDRRSSRTSTQRCSSTRSTRPTTCASTAGTSRASGPGPPTAQYLDRVLTRLTLPGAIYLASWPSLPRLFIAYGGFSQATAGALGGTSVLIAVGVALDTMRQMESQMMMRSYEGFLK